MNEAKFDGPGITRLDPSKHTYAMNNSKLSVNLTYPYSDVYDYTTKLERINLDETRVKDFKIGKGFPIQSSKGIKSDVKNQAGIFSSRFGSTIADIDSFNGKYRCSCGYTKGSIMHGEICPVCGSIVKFYDDDISIFGWLILKDKYYIIHPNIYRTLEGYIGASRLLRIIEPDVQVDSNGRIINVGSANVKKDEPFRGIGMIEFKNRYDEILDYYLTRFPNKKVYYDDLKATKDIAFIHSIPVYSAMLRPSVLESGSILRYQESNGFYMMLSKLVQEINRDDLHIDNKIKEKLILLYETQYNLNKIYKIIIDILSKKKGDVRLAIGGRYAFSCRSVITQDPILKVNEIKLPFAALLELMQQVIINILVKTHNITYSQAYRKWYKALVKNDDSTIYHILEGLIHDTGGLDIIINRNPTIQYGGILKMKCVGINRAYTMSISLYILKPLAADFDGDTLNILMLYNKDFINVTEEVLNPTQMYISRNDGLCASDMLPSRDILINANSMKSLCRYTHKEIKQIEKCLSME